MALRAHPIRQAGGVSSHERPGHDQGIQEAVSIPVMAKVCTTSTGPHSAGHRNRLPTNPRVRPTTGHIDKNHRRRCGAKNLGDSHRQWAIRTKGEPGTGVIPGRAPHAHHEQADPRTCRPARRRGLRGRQAAGRALRSGREYVHDNGRLPVVNFAAGGVATRPTPP